MGPEANRKTSAHSPSKIFIKMDGSLWGKRCSGLACPNAPTSLILPSVWFPTHLDSTPGTKLILGTLLRSPVPRNGILLFCLSCIRQVYGCLLCRHGLCALPLSENRREELVPDIARCHAMDLRFAALFRICGPPLPCGMILYFNFLV